MITFSRIHIAIDNDELDIEGDFLLITVFPLLSLFFESTSSAQKLDKARLGDITSDLRQQIDAQEKDTLDGYARANPGTVVSNPTDPERQAGNGPSTSSRSSCAHDKRASGDEDAPGNAVRASGSEQDGPGSVAGSR